MRRLCQALAVPASGYCAWRQGQGQQRAVGSSEMPAWETALAQTFGAHKRCCAARRLQRADLWSNENAGAVQTDGAHTLTPRRKDASLSPASGLKA